LSTLQFLFHVTDFWPLYCTVQLCAVIIIIIPPESNKVRITIVLAGADDTTPFWFLSKKAAVIFAPAKNELGPIADAFAGEIIIEEYQGKWITAEDYAHIVNYEHNLLSSAFKVDADTRVAALSKDSQYRTADDERGASGVFWKLFCPRTVQSEGTKKSIRVYCYFVDVIKNSLPPINKGDIWYEGLISLGRLLKTRCTF
jgi:hypothetical protein